jgi:hypothetical protein
VIRQKLIGRDTTSSDDPEPTTLATIGFIPEMKELLRVDQLQETLTKKTIPGIYQDVENLF